MRWEGRAFRCVLPRGLCNIEPSPESCGVLWHFWAVLVQVSLVPCWTVVWYLLLWVCTPSIQFQVYKNSICRHWFSSRRLAAYWVPCLAFQDGLPGSLLWWSTDHPSKFGRTLGWPLSRTFSPGICRESLLFPWVVSCKSTFPKGKWWCRSSTHPGPNLWYNSPCLDQGPLQMWTLPVLATLCLFLGSEKVS